MSTNKCYRAIEGTAYDKSIKETFELTPRWSNVSKKVSELLGEKVTRMAAAPDKLRVDLYEIKDPENKKLFTKDGILKKNLKASKELHEKYTTIIKEEGLLKFQDYGLINFQFGTMRMRGQNLESFITLDGQIHFKADFEMRNDGRNMVQKTEILEEISEIEYEETHLDALKKLKEQETS